MPKKHNVLTTALAVAGCKLTRNALHLFRKGGTTLPGRVAMFFDRDILEVASRGMDIIVVTGTNGKTTTSKMIETALEDAGLQPLNNKSGANLLTGVTAEFVADAGFLGQPKTRYAVVESDEAALKQIVPLLHPKVIVVTNLFRDQLDRYGEVMHTLEQIRIGVSECPESTLCLNADCSLTSSLADGVPNRVVWYGVNTPVGSQAEAAVSDARYCIRCGTEYHYTYHTYAHLGGFVCPHCGYARTAPQVAVEEILRTGADGSTVRLGFAEPDGIRSTCTADIALPALYNIYNAAAAIGAFEAAGLPRADILSSLTKISSSFGRMETFDLDGVPVQMILIKNPAGANQSLEYLCGLDEDFQAVFCLNDNIADGRDISWIWDAEFERLCESPHLKQITVSGLRAEDLQLRLKYAGVPEERMTLIRDNHAIIDQCRKSTLPVFILPNYTSMLSLRADISAVTGKDEFWKG